MNVRNAQNLSMLCDFYELTMSNGYFRNGYKDRITYFDLFFRQVPDGGGFAIAAGLEQVVEYITNLHFSDEDIDYLRSRGIFCEEFLQYLRDFRFTGDIWAVPEGTPVFPREPLITVRAPAIEAQLVETYLLLAVNHQSLIATKASRIVRAAAPAGRRGRTRRSSARARRISRAAPAPPARSPTSSTAFPLSARWRTPGCRCSIRSMRRSRPTAKFTPTIPRCSSIPTTRSRAASPTPSAFLPRF